MKNQKQTHTNTTSSCDKRPIDRRWSHPFIGFLNGVGFWVSHVVVAIGVITVVLLTWFEVQCDGPWADIVPAAIMVFGYAVLFAFAGRLVRSNR